MIDNLGNVPVKYIAIKEKNIDKVKESLNKEEIVYNEYENAHEIICDQEAKHAVEMMIINNPDINFDKFMKQIVEKNVFNTLKYSCINLKYEMYNNEYIHEVKQTTIENVKKIIMRIGTTDQIK